MGSSDDGASHQRSQQHCGWNGWMAGATPAKAKSNKPGAAPFDRILIDWNGLPWKVSVATCCPSCEMPCGGRTHARTDTKQWTGEQRTNCSTAEDFNVRQYKFALCSYEKQQEGKRPRGETSVCKSEVKAKSTTAISIIFQPCLAGLGGNIDAVARSRAAVHPTKLHTYVQSFTLTSPATAILAPSPPPPCPHVPPRHHTRLVLPLPRPSPLSPPSAGRTPRPPTASLATDPTPTRASAPAAPSHIWTTPSRQRRHHQPPLSRPRSLLLVRPWQ